MGLFGFKKVDEEPKNNNTFINTEVINAQDYSNMPNNTVVGYQPMDEVINVEPIATPNYDSNNYNGDTFVYSQVNSVDYNNQFVNNQVPQEQVYYDQTVIDNSQVPMEQPTFNNEFSGGDNTQIQNDVVMTIPNNTEFASADVSFDQNVTVQEPVPFDNSALFALPAGAVLEQQEEQIEEEVVVEEPPKVEEPEVVLDPLNNANNPIPVNPVASKEEPKKEEVVEEEEQPLFDEEEEVKTNLFTVLNMMVGVIIKPGTTISQNARRYKRIFDASLITFWVTILSFVMCLAGRIVAGCFSRTHNAISGASKISFNFSGLVDTNNYIPYLLSTLLIGLGAILVVALIYYIASFICSKGVHIGTYFAISTLSLVPVIIAFTILFPIISIVSSGVALMVLIFSVIYALIILFTGINEVLKFKSNDHRILYNAVNMALIFSVMLFIFNTLSRLNIIDMVLIFK